MNRKPRPRLKPWKVADLAAIMEVSIASVTAAARITGRAIVGGMIYLPSTPSRREFIGEAHRAHLANERMEERKSARLSAN